MFVVKSSGVRSEERRDVTAARAASGAAIQARVDWEKSEETGAEEPQPICSHGRLSGNGVR
jgi:hypothetical protein